MIGDVEMKQISHAGSDLMNSRIAKLQYLIAIQANQVIISITPVEARQLATLLNQAADASLADRETRSANNED